MMVSEPMSDERLAEIRAWKSTSPTTLGQGYARSGVYMVELFREVERLRAREAALVALARAVASGEELHPNWHEQARGWLQADEEARRVRARGADDDGE